MKKNLALTGSNGFLGSNLYTTTFKLYNVYKISLKNSTEIEKFLEKISSNSFHIIINCAASLNPKTKHDFYLNEKLPFLISDKIKNKQIKFIHISSINVIFNYLNDPYSISKKNAEYNLKINNVTIIRPSLIIGKDYNISNKFFDNYLKINLPFYPFIFPGNTYRPVYLKNLIDFILIEINKKNDRIINVFGSQVINLFSIFEKYSNLKNKKTLKINLSFLSKILPNKLKGIMNRNQYLQQILNNKRSSSLENKELNIFL